MFFGAALAALGLAILRHLGLITGQTAGLALLISTVTGLAFGPVFFVINLPFYVLAVKRMGWAFTLKTFAAVSLVALFSMLQPRLITFGEIDPLAGAVLAGMLSGAALLALFRHRASLGGIGILAVWLQDRFGIRAGWVQMGIDAAIFGAAFLVLDPGAVLYSMAGAVVLNLVIAINHRRDRYVGF